MGDAAGSVMVFIRNRTVGCGDVQLTAGNLFRAADMCGEQRHGRACFNRPTVCTESDRHRHEPVIQADVKQLLAVVSPSHLRAAVSGDLFPGARAWKRLDENLEATRLVRLVRDPLSVGGKLRIPIVAVRLDDHERFSESLERKCPEVPARPRIAAPKEQRTPIR